MKDEFDVREKWIYFNHAGVAPLPRRTRRAVAEAAEEMKHGAAGADVLARKIEVARESAARLLNCSADEIWFPRSTSEGLSLLARGLRWKKGDSVVVPRMEFPSNVYPWMALAGKGVRVTRPARGLPAGSAIEYVDSGILGEAMRDRRAARDAASSGQRRGPDSRGES